MWIGWLEFDLLLGDVHSLKAKRSLVRPIVAEVRRRFEVSVGEVGHHELHRRAAIGISVVGAESGHVAHMRDVVERFVAERPDVELLSARRGLHSSDD